MAKLKNGMSAGALALGLDRIVATKTSSPFALGYAHALDHQSAIERYNARPPDRCPYQKGTPEEREYDRGWKAFLAEPR